MPATRDSSVSFWFSGSMVMRNPDLQLFAFLHMSLLEHSFRNADRLTITPFDELSANGCHKVYVIQGIYVGIYVSRKALRADKSGRRLNGAEFRNDIFELSYAPSPTSTGLVPASGLRVT